MAFDELPRGQRFGQDRDHARMRVDDGAHVHHFRQAGDFRPGEELTDLLCLKICARTLRAPAPRARTTRLAQ